ncbi:hypothetical protein Syun_018259 [Stephania yunnanensis]|uniref:MSP domain-containing protein n=1 Tax=Stephania yunnanensis TaxID=152371 RepID=A0AAP0IRW9_9MAGN
MSLRIQPHELKFRDRTVEPKKQSSCSLQLTNRLDRNIAFKVKTTNPKKYSVRPNAGIVPPGASFDVTVTMQAQKDVPTDMQSKDKFLIQWIAAPIGMTSQEITSEMFGKEAGNAVEEFKLRVIYVLTNIPSPVREGSEEGVSPRVSALENGSNSAFESKDKALEVWTTITKLTNEKI